MSNSSSQNRKSNVQTPKWRTPQPASPHQALNLPQNLGDRLIMRLATTDDIDALAAFNKRIHTEEDDPPQGISLWTRDLMSGNHPTTSAADFILVEDTAANNNIVSATCLIPQVWAYDGIPFPVGQPELVGTDKAYRRRGLTRAIFEQIHHLSKAYGHLAEGLLGIPWFYRQFGYEYALPLGGGRPLFLETIPALKEGETEPYRIRPATEADIPTLMRLYERHCIGNRVTAVLDEARWGYDLSARSAGAQMALKTFCILAAEGRLSGYYRTMGHVWRSHLQLLELMVEAGISLHAVLPTVTRALKKQGETMVDPKGTQKLNSIFFRLSPGHPAFDALDAKLGPQRSPYSWYIRVADLPAFIGHIAPALEKRLGHSLLSGYSGTLDITFYRGGLQLAFEQGKLTNVSNWQAPDPDEDWQGAGFPPLVFLQLLFGHRSLAELRYAFPDCWADEEATLLLNALFPKQASWVVSFG